MTAVFADSSALVKLYADEPGAELVRALAPLVMSQLARVEVPAALWRKHRIGELSPADAAVLVAAFEADYFGTEEEPERFLVIAAQPRRWRRWREASTSRPSTAGFAEPRLARGGA